MLPFCDFEVSVMLPFSKILGHPPPWINISAWHVISLQLSNKLLVLKLWTYYTFKYRNYYVPWHYKSSEEIIIFFIFFGVMHICLKRQVTVPLYLILIISIFWAKLSLSDCMKFETFELWIMWLVPIVGFNWCIRRVKVRKW